MVTAVAVTSHGQMLSPLDRRTPRAHVFGAPGEQSLEDALTGMQALLAGGGHVVLVHPASLPEAHLHRLHSIRSVLESDRIALVPVPLPPLGTAVLALQLRQLSLGGFSPGVLGAAARLLAHYVYAGAVLGSVTRLDHVPVPLSAHAMSWLPGRRFAVLAAPQPRLVALGGEEGALGEPEFTVRLTAARGQLDTDWVHTGLARRWQAGEVLDVRLPEESPRWWGTGRLVEFAAAIPDAGVLHRLVSSARRGSCHWCGLELLGDRCAFCAASAPVPAPGTGPAGPAAAPSLSEHAVVADPRGLLP